MRCARCLTEWSDDLAAVLKYCGACGSPMAAAADEGQRNGVLAGGELRHVTVLFADLAGFTAFAEERSADDVARFVGDLMQELGQVVTEHGASVDKFLGDAVMATFGYPRADPAPGRHAVRAGLAMQECVRRFCAAHELYLLLRVGIHAGEAMFRTVGDSFTAMGDAVNTASRIQSVAQPGKVWVSQPVHEEARRFFSMAPRPAIELRGKRRSVPLYEVLEERSTPLSESPRFVGREREWQALLDALGKARTQQKLTMVVVRGPAGVGKSRLLKELRDWLTEDEATYRWDIVQYDHYERLPSHGLSSLLRRRFQLPVDLDQEALLDRLAKEMPREDPFVEPGREALAVEFLAFVLGLLAPSFRIQSMDGKGKWDGAFVELKQWLEGWARETPWVLVFEDAQKGDEKTAAFLDWALRVRWTAPVLVVATIREEDFDSESHWHPALACWRKENLASEIVLKELAPEVLSASLPGMVEGQLSPALARRIADHAEGNPLFATELVLLLRDRGLLCADHPWDRGTLPTSIREVMEARIERLGPLAKEVAKRGALMGRRFTQESVRRIWELSEQDLDRGLVTLRETETIYEEESRQLDSQTLLVFRHGRMQEAALTMIPRRDRLRWRRSLAAWARPKIESLGTAWEGAGTLLIPAIALSLEEAGDAWEASLWFEALGLLHRRHHRARESADVLRRALPLARGRRRLVLCRLIAQAEQFAGDPEHALAIANEVTDPGSDEPREVPAEVRRRLESLARDDLDRWDVVTELDARVSLDLARADVLGTLGRVAEARALYEAIDRQLEGSAGKDAGVRLWLRFASNWIHFLSERAGNPREADEACRRVRARVDLSDPALEDLRLAFLHAEGYVQSRLGHFDAAERSADERLHSARATGNRRVEREAWNAKGIVHFARGELSSATSCMQQALEVSRSIGDRMGEAIALHNIALSHYYLGEWEASRDHQERYMALSRAIGNRLAEAYGPTYLGALAMTMGSYDEAEDFLGRAQRTAEENGWPRLVALAAAFRAETFMLRSLREPRGDLLDRAVEELRGSEEGWSYFDDAGELYACLALAQHLRGDRDAARSTIAAARARTHDSWVVHRVWLDLAEAMVEGGSVEGPLDWFRKAGYVHPGTVAARVIARLTRRESIDASPRTGTA